MSSTLQDTGSNDIGRGRTNKSNKTQRSWSSRKKEVLLAALKELVAQGWKSDNRFRAGYLGKLEEAVKNTFPGIDLKGMPYIHSKISTWKKNYYSLTHMLDRSGIGFNVDGNHMIDCNNEQWEQIVKCDANARLMRYKGWPHLDDWKEIFGKDRATGTNVEDVMDVVNDMHRVDNLEQDEVDGDYHVHLEEEAENDARADNVAQSEKNGGVARSSGKKRKASEGFDGLYELMGEISRNADKRMDIVASRIGYEFDLGNARKEVFDQLNNMVGLSMDKKFDAYEILAGEKQGLKLFMGLPTEAKPHYVMRILNNKKARGDQAHV